MNLKSFLIKYVFLLCLSFLSTATFADLLTDLTDSTTQSAPRDFNHSQTGFPLIAGHALVDCETCHAGAIFKGTPRNCAGCHSKGAHVIATVMSSSHIATNAPCETCHFNTATFLGARFNHNRAAMGACTTCHNGIISTPKPASHNRGLKNVDACGQCHITVSWFPARYDHVGITPGSCAAQCHNGALATGKPSSHTTQLKSTATCDTCHRFTSWLPTFYNHSAVAPGTCANCHNGASATNKPANHTGAKASMVCDNCHRTTAWLPAAYNHLGIAPGSCLTCHAAQRPTSHTAHGYLGTCDTCHSINPNWAFNHDLQQGRHTCNNCHSRDDHHGSGTQPCDNCHTVRKWD